MHRVSQKTPTTFSMFLQDGTPVRNRTVCALWSIELYVPHVVNKPNMCSTLSSPHYKLCISYVIAESPTSAVLSLTHMTQ